MDIRVMTIDDYDKIYELWTLCEGLGLNSVDDSREGIGKFLIKNSDTCFVAEINGEVVGTIMAGNDGRRGYIYHTAVAPKFRNMKIASALVDKALEALAECGISKTVLAVFDNNEEGNKFWDKKGFELRREVLFRIKTICDLADADT